jgi:prophage regulatory protein
MPQPSNALASTSSVQRKPSQDNVEVLLLRIHAVLRVTGLSRSTLYRLIADESFPRPVRLGPRAVAWRRSDIDAWSEARSVATH